MSDTHPVTRRGLLKSAAGASVAALAAMKPAAISFGDDAPQARPNLIEEENRKSGAADWQLRLQWTFWDWQTSRREREVLALRQDIVRSKEDAFTQQLTAALQQQPDPCNEYRHRRPQHPFGTEFDQGIVAVQAQHHADGNRCQADDGDRLHADEIDLLQDLVHLQGPAEHEQETAQKKQGVPPQAAQTGNGEPPQAVQRQQWVGHGVHGSRFGGYAIGPGSNPGR